MPVRTTLGPDSVQLWLLGEEHEQALTSLEKSLAELSADDPVRGPSAQEILRRRAERGPLEQAFIPMFSIRECDKSYEPGGARMGVDPHYDARQGILALAQMVDKEKYTRAAIYKEECENTMGFLNVDIVALDGTTVWCLPDYPKEPIIFVRCAFIPGMTNAVESERFRYRMHTCISKTVPSIGLNNIPYGSREVLDIYLRVFKENASKMSPELKAKIEAGVDRCLLDIPTSFTSFFTLLLPDEVPRSRGSCRVCGSEGLKTCSKCKVAKYCSKECQVKDWKAGHRRECRPPEEVAIAEAASSDAAGNQEGQWVDVDPKATDAHFQKKYGRNVVSCSRSTSEKEPMYRISNHPIRTSGKVLDGIKRDKMMAVKVQILNPGSTPEDHDGVLIYPQGKRFEMVSYPWNTGRGFQDYARLHSLIKARGTDSGLGKGGCKAFLDAYVTSEGKLRVMMNEVKPLEAW